MKKNRASSTALGIASMRAFESDRAEGERVCYDPFARAFVPDILYWLGKFFIATGYAERRGPGVMGFLAVRERYMDDVLLAYQQGGMQQLVLLGAGYDSRPYRLPVLQQGVQVFEVDHPATQARKITCLQSVMGALPPGVHFVAIDFNTQSLEQRLLESGYQPGQKTLFVWQGVVCYLTAEAVDHTLDFIRRCSGPGSAVVFDYVDQSVLEGALGHSEVNGMQRYRGLTGEGLTFGIPDGTIEPFLVQRGFTQIKNIDSAGLKARYFTGKRQSQAVISGYQIVFAVVDTAAGMDR